jgi:uncharacterized membrane protein
MKNYAVIGFILIALGIAALAYQGFRYTTRDTIVDLGPLQVKADRTHNVPLPPILGAVAIAGGVTLLFMGRGKN